MAAAIPVLERRSNTSDNTEEVQHNARIKDNYARLVNPNISPNELMGREEPVPSSAQNVNLSEYYKANPREALFGNRTEINLANTPTVAEPYLVTNARADADIFRADSPVNQRYITEQQTVNSSVEPEEDNEDLRPTRTTIQYGSSERMDDEIIPSSTVKATSKKETRSTIGKREKIIIGTFISMVVALFVLVIINSAIISKINSDISDAEQSLVAIQSEYAQIYESVEEARSADSVYEYIQQNGMVFEGTED